MCACACRGSKTRGLRWIKDLLGPPLTVSHPTTSLLVALMGIQAVGK